MSPRPDLGGRACRGDLPSARGSLQDITLQLVCADSPWAGARAESHERAALTDIHKRHVQGEATGRSAPLRRLCATVQHAHVICTVQRVRKWALQAGLCSDTGAGGPDPALETLCAQQLAAYLADEFAGVLAAHTLTHSGATA